MHGGWTNHACTIVRSMGKPAVTGVGVCKGVSLRIDCCAQRLHCPDGSIMLKGDIVTVDGMA